ncbi:MAG TPA: MarR family transcriptional regulator [Clostridiaceae bacterium]|nr:MarR family transcriptional regulator [Clostridiaceae bacterium]
MEEANKGFQVIKLLKQVKNVVSRNMCSQFKELNLTGTQSMLIGILAHNQKIKISDLSSKLGLSNSTVSGIIDRLESRGLVKRIRSQEDRRVVYVCVSDKYMEEAQKRFKQIDREFEAIMNKATPEELDTIIKGLSTLKTVVSRQNVNY